ncbi:putative toxin-antitoxin system toxin component, PIN family [soil metagenome]
MRVVLDTNVLLSALIAPGSVPDGIYRAWEEGRFELVTSEWQLDELRRASRYPRLKKYVKPSEAGAMIRGIRGKAQVLDKLPRVELAPDPDDDQLLATALKGRAQYLVTGDKGLLDLRKIEHLRIVQPGAFLRKVLGRTH